MRRQWAAVCIGLCLSAGVCAADIKLPSGIDPYRLRLLERGEPLKVYVNMVGIDDKSSSHLLVPARVGESIGTATQMNQRFLSAVEQTKRFSVQHDDSSGVRSESDIVVEGMVVAATQDIVNMTSLRKAVTTLRLSVQIKENSADGEIGRAHV